MDSLKTILVTGATGLVGRPLCAALTARGHTVRTLSRSDCGDFQWDVAAGQMDTAAVAGVDVIIHLAGENIAQRWTEAAKRRILTSRTESARLLIEAALKQPRLPAYLSASGISYYGIDREDTADESSGAGSGFLAEVTRQWEGAASSLEAAGGRCVYLRTGIVLSAQGGALAKMLTPFKLGVGGRIGDGRQMMSWISLPDLVQAYVFAVENESLRGPVNAVAPEAVSNRDFTKTLGKVLGRPTIFPLPASVVKALFGDMGAETVLSNLAVKPRLLAESGFRWQHETLENALQETI
jgi:uncharacterized protein (TIGR01777 family)